MRVFLSVLTLCAFAAGSGVSAQPASHRRALLIGINDYTASRIGARPNAAPVPNRDWPNLAGAVNDVNTLREMLVPLYGFDRNDIVTLTDQAATREAIFQSLERLVNDAAKNDVVLFYYAGHGSQVRNSLSEERDKLDESIVPADSRAGADDIRDKELATYFNRILDRGARLTVMLDNCHSGSGARGLSTGGQARSVKPDLRDVADRTSIAKPEDHGALVLTASEDFDTAWETRDAEGKFHGEFSWAWMRAMRDAGSGEPASETFLRAQARMRAETPYQQPVMSGRPDARMSPFLGSRTDFRGDHIVVAVEKVQSDGTVVIQGGWVNGISAGTELRDPASSSRLTVTALRGIAESEARVEPPGAAPHSGSLLEVVVWAAPPVPPLHIWAPRSPNDAKQIAAVAHSMAEEAKNHRIRWITNPLEATPAHLMRWGDNEWELVSDDGDVERIGQDTSAVAAVARLAAGSTLFVQLPVPAALFDAAKAEGVETAARLQDADYVLVGRFVGQHLSFAWLRPATKKSDRRKTGLPLQTAWITEPKNDSRLRHAFPALHEQLLRLRNIRAWHLLESPPAERFPYRLAVRRAGDEKLATDGESIIGGEKYELVLRAVLPFPPHIPPRYLYAFVIDSYGKSTLLFPQNTGSVENRFPASPPPTEIALGDDSAFEASFPYGVDTYFLLTTEEPLPDPSIFERPGVRAPNELTPLEKLLALTASGARTVSIATPSKWSITKTTYESLAPHTTKATK
jgi:hypothetical protein